MLDLKELVRFAKDVKSGYRPAVSVKVNRSEVDLLILLTRRPDQPFRYYGRRLHLEKGSFSYVVDLLVLKELVVKVEDAEDKRRKTLALTTKGKELVQELKEQDDKFIMDRLSIFTEEEMKDLEKAVEVCKVLGDKVRKQFPREDRRPEGRRPRHHRHPKRDCE